MRPWGRPTISATSTGGEECRNGLRRSWRFYFCGHARSGSSGWQVLRLLDRRAQQDLGAAELSVLFGVTLQVAEVATEHIRAEISETRVTGLQLEETYASLAIRVQAFSFQGTPRCLTDLYGAHSVDVTSTAIWLVELYTFKGKVRQSKTNCKDPHIAPVTVDVTKYVKSNKHVRYRSEKNLKLRR